MSKEIELKINWDRHYLCTFFPGKEISKMPLPLLYMYAILFSEEFVS